MSVLKMARLWLSVVLLCAAPLCHADTVQAFVSGSWGKLQQQKPHIVSFWSIDCSSCYQELALWQKLSQHYPKLKLILVATDPPASADDVKAVLQEHKLSHLNNWHFAEAHSQKLRYEIDPNWHGELPRHYFFDSQGKPHGISGLLNEAALQQQIKQWLPN